MGQLADKFTNKIKDNDGELGDLICPKCNSQLLIELFQSKERIMLRHYCLCGSLTTNINKEILLMVKSSNFYQGHRCHQINDDDLSVYNDSSIKKYCVECDKFLCTECFKKHIHNKIIDAKNYLFNCIYHRDMKIIGFCRTCKISFCNKCFENKYHHKKHDIIYINNQKDINDILKIYELNLNKAFIKLNELIKIKYGKELKSIPNLFEPLAIKSELDAYEIEILFCLELLKTFLDIYYFKQKNNLLDYQSIAHIIKHRDFEVVRLKETEVKKTKAHSSRIVSIGSDDYKTENKEKNDLIYIGLKIYLKEKEKRENEINIELDEYLQTTALHGNQKVIKLKNGDLASSHSNCIEFDKNFEKPGRLINESGIIDFDELENETICILVKQIPNDFELLIYKREDIGDYRKIKIINLNVVYSYYKIKSIPNNNIALLSYIKDQKTAFSLLQYPNYKENHIKLLDIDSEGDMIQMDNLIIICFGLLDYCIIYFYNITNNTMESINIENHQTYKKACKCFKMNEKKILISTAHTGIIFNIKSKQTEAFIRDFKNINFFVNIGNYQLVGKKNIISQINIKKGRLCNKYKYIFTKKIVHEGSIDNILDIIDAGNNKFYAPLDDNAICLFNYN